MNSFSSTAVAVSATVKSPPSELIRGGRLRKTSKGLVSFAPFLAGVSVFALGAMLASTSPVEAGICTDPGVIGRWVCSAGPDSGGRDLTQTIEGRANQSVSVYGTRGINNVPSFGLNSSNTTNYGIRVTSEATTTTITVNLSQSNNITSHNDAVRIDSNGTGAVVLTTNGTIRSNNNEGIDISQSGNGDVTVTTDGTVTGHVSGIQISTAAATTGEVNLTTNAAVTGGTEGIKLDIDGNNAVTVMATGTVTSSTSEEAIEVEHSGTGDVDITIADTVTATAAAKDAVRVNHSGTGNITLTVNGSVVGGSSANAINLSTTSASSNATIVLGTGASFTGGIDVSSVMGAASIEIGGTGDRSFDIGDTPAITGDHNFDKDGDHTLTVTGTHASGTGFAQTNINEGKLVWEGSIFRTGGLAIADGATLEITDDSSFSDASVTLSGRLELTGNGTNFAIGSLAGDGEIDIDVDFSGGDAELTNARLRTTSVTGTIPVNIRSMNEFQVSDNDEDGFITLQHFIAVVDSANSNAFVAGDVLDGGSFDFNLVYNSAENRWDLVACPVGAGCQAASGSFDALLNSVTLLDVALYESLPAALSQLADLESRQQRLRGRQHAGNTAMWGKVGGASEEFEPNSAAGATYEAENIVAEFGVDVPIRSGNSSFNLGASVAFGDAGTDVSVPVGTGEIASESIISTINAGWEHRGVYADGQLRYSSFDNSIEKDAKIADVDVKAYTAGVEVGYAMELDKLIRIPVFSNTVLIPSAQLSWTSVDFDDFTDTVGTNVALGDGDVLLARTGVAFEDSWEGIDFRGHADVLVPLDGEVATKLNGTEITSKREDPAFDVGVGATYSWGGAYALSADVSTQQGGEVAGYAASLGFVYSFF